MQTQNKRKN